MSRGSPAKWDQPEVRRYVTYCTKSKPHKLSESGRRMISVLFVTRNWKKSWITHLALSATLQAFQVVDMHEMLTSDLRIHWVLPGFSLHEGLATVHIPGLTSWLFSSLGPSLIVRRAAWVEFKQCRVKTNRRVVKRGFAVLGSKPAL